jgi:hypothetical protein
MGGGASTAAPRIDRVASYVKELRRRGAGKTAQLQSALANIETLSQVPENRRLLASPQVMLLQELSSLLVETGLDLQIRYMILRILSNISSDPLVLSEVVQPPLGLSARLCKLLLEADAKTQDYVLDIFKLLLAAPDIADQLCSPSSPLLGNVVAALRTDLHRLLEKVMDIIDILAKNNKKYYNYFASQQLGLLAPLVLATRGAAEPMIARIIAFLLSAASESTVTENDKYMCSPKLNVYKAALNLISSLQLKPTDKSNAALLLEKLFAKADWSQDLDELVIFPGLTAHIEDAIIGKQVRQIIKKLARSRSGRNKVFLASQDSGLLRVCRELFLNATASKDLQVWSLRVIEALLESNDAKMMICLDSFDIVIILASIVRDQIPDLAIPALKLLSVVSSVPVGAEKLLSSELDLQSCIINSIKTGVLDAKHFSLSLLFNISEVVELRGLLADPSLRVFKVAVPLVQDVNPDISCIILNCLHNLVACKTARYFIGSEALGLMPRLVALFNFGGNESKKICLKICLALSECDALHSYLGTPSLGLVLFLQSLARAKGSKNTTARVAVQIVANILRTSATICEASESPAFCTHLVGLLNESERNPGNWADDSTESTALLCLMHFSQWSQSHSYLIGQSGLLAAASRILREENNHAKKCLIALVYLVGSSEFQGHMDLLTSSKTSIKELTQLIENVPLRDFDEIILLRALYELSNNDFHRSLLSTKDTVKILEGILKIKLDDTTDGKSPEDIERGKNCVEIIVKMFFSLSLQCVTNAESVSSGIFSDFPILIDLIEAVRRNRHVSLVPKRAACLLASRLQNPAHPPPALKPGAPRPFVAVVYSWSNRSLPRPAGVDALLSMLRTLGFKVLCIEDGVCLLDDQAASPVPPIDCSIDAVLEASLMHCGAVVVCLSNEMIKAPATR